MRQRYCLYTSLDEAQDAAFGPPIPQSWGEPEFQSPPELGNLGGHREQVLYPDDLCISGSMRQRERTKGGGDCFVGRLLECNGAAGHRIPDSDFKVGKFNKGIDSFPYRAGKILINLIPWGFYLPSIWLAQ